MRSSERARCSTEGAERGRAGRRGGGQGVLAGWLVGWSDVDDGCRMSDVGKREAGVRGMEPAVRGGEGVRGCASTAGVVLLGLDMAYGSAVCSSVSGSDDSGDRGNIDGQERPGLLEGEQARERAREA